MTIIFATPPKELNSHETRFNFMPNHGPTERRRMEPLQALLILPQPPQRPAFSHVWAALHLPLTSILRQISEGLPGLPAIVDIALPVTRIVQASSTQSECFMNISLLLGNIYRLLAAITQELSIPLDGPGSVDVRVLLVREVIGDSIHEINFPLIVSSFTSLAASPRQWNRIFAIESEQGESIYQEFCSVCRMYGPDRRGLFTRVQRLPGGIQIFVQKSPSSVLTPPSPAPEDDVEFGAVGILISGTTAHSLADKHVLTMGLFAACHWDAHQLERTERAPKKHIWLMPATGSLDLDVKARVSLFLQSLLDTHGGEDAQPSTFQPEAFPGFELRFSTLAEFAASDEGQHPRTLVASEVAQPIADAWKEKGPVRFLVVKSMEDSVED